jgi:methionyl-tRNA synthetase
MWSILKDKGLITQGQHTGFYSVNEECFVMEKDLVWNQEGKFYETEMGEKVAEI